MIAPVKSSVEKRRLLSKNKPDPIPREVLENILNGFHWIFIWSKVGVNIKKPKIME